VIWLGESRGYLSDWVTQLWVRVTGRRVAIDDSHWLSGPTGAVTGIGMDYFERLAAREGLVLDATKGAAPRGLLGDFGDLAAADFAPGAVHPSVAEFYTRTSEYDLDAWAQWCGLFRPFGWLLSRMFSRRLQQLNVPLSGLDTSRGVTSDVIHLRDPRTGEVRYTAWVRRLLGSGDVLYVGSYSLATIPGRAGACVKVVFPLPNGNGIVIMRPVAHPDGSFSVVSSGRGFGDPGFYFTVKGRDGTWSARYVRALKESIRVYPAVAGEVRADHALTLFGARFMDLHYRLRRRATTAPRNHGVPPS
jgi:hypothetical protein